MRNSKSGILIASMEHVSGFYSMIAFRSGSKADPGFFGSLQTQDVVNQSWPSQ